MKQPDIPITSAVRHVRRTWDGRKIGHVEPLESEAALRLAISRRVNFISLQKKAQARENNLMHTNKIGQAQRASATKRAKGSK